MGDRKLVATLIATISLSLFAHTAGGYQEQSVSDGGTIKGTVTFSGKVPPPRVFRIDDFETPRYCRKISDGRGNRLLHDVRVGDGGGLQDVVVFIGDIDKGKPFKFEGAGVHAMDCQFLIQGGPSPQTGVVVPGKEMWILNQDADPSNPKTMLGIKHNPQANEVFNGKKELIFKLLNSTKGLTSRRTINLKKKKSHIVLSCDVHDYMEVAFVPVTNPYYAVVDSEGQFVIDEIPPGKYTLTAWHRMLGEVEKKVKIPPKGTVSVEFSFSD